MNQHIIGPVADAAGIVTSSPLRRDFALPDQAHLASTIRRPHLSGSGRITKSLHEVKSTALRFVLGFERAQSLAFPVYPPSTAAVKNQVQAGRAALEVGARGVHVVAPEHLWCHASRSNEPGTISALIAVYYGTPEFTSLADSSRETYRNMLERFREAHGQKQVATLT